ncbi:hypothetical protein [Aeromonas dhakensis]|nr:hypothetical protein [Aeromonas dhakensis]
MVSPSCGAGKYRRARKRVILLNALALLAQNTVRVGYIWLME